MPNYYKRYHFGLNKALKKLNFFMNSTGTWKQTDTLFGPQPRKCIKQWYNQGETLNFAYGANYDEICIISKIRVNKLIKQPLVKG